MKEEDDEEERETNKRQKDGTNSNKRLKSGAEKFQVEDVSVKVCQSGR